MLRDDRVMSILTGLVIVVAMSMLAQRADEIAGFLFDEAKPRFEPADDAAEVVAGGSVLIDVLANDLNLSPGAAGRLRIAASPACGAAEIAEDGVLYVASDRCEGGQVVGYCVAEGDECRIAEIHVSVRPAPAAAPPEPEPEPAAAAPAGPAAATEPEAAPLPGAPEGAAPGGSGAAPAAAPRIFASRPAPGRPAPREAAGEPRRAEVAPPPALPPAQGFHVAERPAAEAAGPEATPEPAVFVAYAPETPEPEATPGTASGATAADCPLALSARPGPGGASLVALSAPCRPGAAAELTHAGLAVSVRLDGAGTAEIALPVLDAGAGVEARLPGGPEAAGPLAFDEAEVARLIRVAVGWTDPVRLTLHAFEPGGAHLRPGAERDAEAARREGGGFLLAYPAAEPGAPAAEVWSVWLGPRTRPGLARLALDHASRGAVASAPFCGASELARPAYSVIRAERGEVRARARGRFAAAECGARLDEAARLGTGALAEVRIE